MLATVLHVGAIAAGIGLVAIGVHAIAFPGAASRFYGIPASGNPAAQGFAAAAGWRDLALGVAVLIVAVTGPAEATGTLIAAGTLLPIGDLVVLARHRVPSGVRYLPHAVGAVGMAVIAAGLLLT